MKTLALTKNRDIGVSLYGSLAVNLLGRHAEFEPPATSKPQSERTACQYLVSGKAGYGKMATLAQLELNWLQQSNESINLAEYTTPSKASPRFSYQDIVSLNSCPSGSSPNIEQHFTSYLDAITKIHDFDTCEKVINTPGTINHHYAMIDESMRFPLMKWIMHFADHGKSMCNIELARVSVPSEETPTIRAKRLLNDFRESIRRREPFGDRSKILNRLATGSTEVQEELWKVLTEPAHPRLRWLAMEILASFQWQKLAPFIARGLRVWDRIAEREAWLGAVVTIRKYPVPKRLRTPLANILRTSLESATESALSGHDIEQTEVVCEMIDTFRSFADPTDLCRLRRFWQPDCTFTVQLRAFDAASMVARRFPEDLRTEAFFTRERDLLAERLFDLARERMVAIEMGALLWRVAGLLVARLGDEASSIVSTAEKYHSLIGRLRRLLRDSESNLIRNKHEAWLNRQRDFVTSLREKLDNSEKR